MTTAANWCAHQARRIGSREPPEAPTTSAHGHAAEGESVASSKEGRAANGEVTNVAVGLHEPHEELKMPRSELGTFIARNHEEIEQLRRQGERAYIEFKIEGRGKPQKVRNLTVVLRNMNPDKNLFTLTLEADGVIRDYTDETINEPIFLYI